MPGSRKGGLDRDVGYRCFKWEVTRDSRHALWGVIPKGKWLFSASPANMPEQSTRNQGPFQASLAMADPTW